MLFAADVGVTSRLQLGAMFSVPRGSSRSGSPAASDLAFATV
jgi:hypothetical protein